MKSSGHAEIAGTDLVQVALVISSQNKITFGDIFQTSYLLYQTPIYPWLDNYPAKTRNKAIHIRI